MNIMTRVSKTKLTDIVSKLQKMGINVTQPYSMQTILVVEV